MSWEGYWGEDADTPDTRTPPCKDGRHSQPWDDNGTLRCGMCGAPMRQPGKKEKRGK